MVKHSIFQPVEHVVAGPVTGDEAGPPCGRSGALLAGLSAAVIVADGSGTVRAVEGLATELIGQPVEACVGRPLTDFLTFGDESPMHAERNTEQPLTCEGSLLGVDGRYTPVVVARAPIALDGERQGDGDGDGEGHGDSETATVYTAIDIGDRKRLEVELRHAQRLEAIGSLAAGVAHELNTPIQYVLDSVRFIADSIDDLAVLDEQHRALRDLAHGLDGGADLVDAIEREEEARDLEFTRTELPGAVDRAISGLQRMSSIVKAMRRFSHPGEDFVEADINQVVETAVTLSAHEYKYVADIELDLRPVPQVRCNKVDLSGVIVNLLVNAAHAIGNSAAGSDRRGSLRVATSVDDGFARIDVADDGGGIAAEIRDRVFEPFFTTKGPGKGTGQGLALAYDTVVARHNGRLTFDVVDGVGTTFHIWLPIEGAP
ncbi:MAG: ATP-binding protein [Actinomycetota bacterium]